MKNIKNNRIIANDCFREKSSQWITEGAIFHFANGKETLRFKRPRQDATLESIDLISPKRKTSMAIKEVIFQVIRTGPANK